MVSIKTLSMLIVPFLTLTLPSSFSSSCCSGSCGGADSGSGGGVGDGDADGDTSTGSIVICTRLIFACKSFGLWDLNLNYGTHTHTQAVGEWGC